MGARPWTVCEHRPIEKLDGALWIVRGAIPGMSMPLERTMAVARRADGTLVIHSAIALGDASMREVESFGEPRVLIVPNGWHRLDAHAYKERYPALRVYCPRSQTKAVSEVVEVDGAIEDFESDSAVSAQVLDGLDKESVMSVRSEGRTTLVFGDTIMNVGHMKGAAGFMYRMIGASGGAKVHPFMRVMSRGKRLKAQLARLAETPGLGRIVPGHGDPIETDTDALLRRLAR